MDNERAMRTELRRALDDVLPPAPWLAAAVTEDLRRRRSRSSPDRGSRKSPRTWTAVPLSSMQLAAVVLVIVLAAAAGAAFLDLHYRATQVAPAAFGPAGVSSHGESRRLRSSRISTGCSPLFGQMTRPGWIARAFCWTPRMDGSTPSRTASPSRIKEPSRPTSIPFGVGNKLWQPATAANRWCAHARASARESRLCPA